MKIRFSITAVDPARLAQMCGGDLRHGTDTMPQITGICTDSREADAETAFVALRGERVDGHDYISAALARGCRCVLCEYSNEELAASGAFAIVVKDSEMALATMAYAYRGELSCRTVGVTGSVGKTTTKDMIAAVLSERFSTYCTEGNHNSLVGMPMSVMEIPTTSEYAVLEMGMSDFGEIERLSSVAEPQIAVITNIGSSHMERLGSRENICRAKLEILCGLREGGVLLLNGDEPLLRGIGGKSYRTQYVSIEREDCAVFAQNIRVSVDKTQFDCVCDGKSYCDLTVRVMGRHNVYAALFAVAVGQRAGMSEEEIRRGLARFAPAKMRQNVYTIGGITVLEDCYNASPESMTAAISVLSEYAGETGKRSVAVLGDMLELGADSPSMHRNVGAYLATQRIDRLYTVGAGAEQIAVGARQKRMPADRIVRSSSEDAVEQTAKRLLSELREGDAVLFKASRAMGLERIIACLKENL